MIPSLNLLSPLQKKELIRSKIFLIVHEVLLLLFIGIVVGSSVLLGARLILEKKFREVILEQVPGTTEVAKANKDISDINYRIRNLNRITSSFTYMSPLIIKLVNYTPDGVTWNALKIEENNKFTLTGNSKKRADLVQFIDALNADPLIEKIDLPLQYLVPEESINFTLQGIIKDELLQL